MNNSQFIKLCARGWSIPILASIAGGVPARISPVAAKLGAGRNAIGQTFLYLQEAGFMERAAGHGHPLRPEFVLTPLGERTANWSEGLAKYVPDQWEVARKTWSLPVMRLLDESQRYGDLRKALSPITDRALSLCLERLTEHRWIERQVWSDMRPPQVSYRAQNIGLRLMPSMRSSYGLQAH